MRYLLISGLTAFVSVLVVGNWPFGVNRPITIGNQVVLAETAGGDGASTAGGAGASTAGGDGGGGGTSGGHIDGGGSDGG